MKTPPDSSPTGSAATPESIETATWGSAQLTSAEIARLSPDQLDAAHKAGALTAVINGENDKLLRIRSARPATERTQR